jgi:hypothetical protein
MMVWLVVADPAKAAPNSVRIDPASTAVAVGGRVTLDLVAEPPVGGLAAWVVEVGFDASVVTTETGKCDPADAPPGSTAIVGCEATDANADGANDNVKVFGALVFSDGGGGLEVTTVLAAITFEAIGSFGECTDVTVRVGSFTDSEGTETNPTLVNGEICVMGSLPTTTGESPPTVIGTSGGLPPTGASPSDGSGPGGWLLAGIIGLGLAALGTGAWAVARRQR